MASSEAPAGGLLAQHRLLLAVIDTDWATRLDHKVAAVIIQRYYPKYGNARASLRFIAEAVRSDRGNVIDSTRRLVHHGAFSVVREGKGTRPTEYGLNFSFSASGGVCATSKPSDPSGGVETTSCGGVEATSSESSGGVGTTKTYLPVSGRQAGIQDRENEDCAPPSAPPGSALGGPTGADGHKKEKTKFDELWSAYGHRQARTAARVAYDKLAPDPDLHVEMIEAATAWRAHWERQGNPDAPRKTLAKWIETEAYHEDPPTGYKPREKKVSADRPAKPAPVASNDNAEKFADWDVGAFSPFGTFTGTIVESDVNDGETGDIDVVLGFDTTGNGSADIHHTIHLQNHDQRKQERGQRFFTEICKFADLYSVEGTEELHGTEATFTIDKRGQITYQGGRPGQDTTPQPPLPESASRPINRDTAPWRQA